MDRRDFIKYMGAGAAALTLDSCTPKAAKNAGKAGTSNKDLHGEMLQNYPGIGVLGYGCMRWPQKRNEQGRNVIDQEEVNRLVDFALEHGVNYFDTSPVYLGGDSERATAEALNRHPRESWKIATKMSVFNVGLGNSSLVENQVDCPGMVFNKKPVAHVFALAIDWKWFLVLYVVDKQWNKFFWELIWSVIVRAVCYNCRHAVCVVECADKMVGTRLTCRVGGVRSVFCCFVEEILAIRQMMFR